MKISAATVPVVASIAWLIAACASPPLPPAVTPTSCGAQARQTAAVLLVGDAGALTIGGAESSFSDPVLGAVQADVSEMIEQVGGDETAVIFLGDNVYANGLVPEDHEDRARGEAILDEQIRAAGGARIFFTLGNHDWKKADPVGREELDRALVEGRYLEEHAARPRLLPKAGCAGPVVVDFGESLRFVFIDFMGWLLARQHPDEVPETCRYRDGAGFDEALAAIYRNSDRTVLLTLHHPLLTSGPHGGHFTWKQHLFPLTDFWKSAWIPLPILGSVYPLARKSGVSNTDLSHADYRRMIETLTAAQSPSAPTLLLAGHDHSLQVHRTLQGRIQIVSGAGSVSKVSRVEETETAMMAIARPGYVRLDEFDDSLRITLVAVGDDSPREIYQTCVEPGSHFR